MKFRSYVEPPEPMRGLEVPPEVVEALGGGKRPAVTITINGHSWKSRVAIMRGRYLLGLSNANRQAAGVVTGDEVEVEVEIDAEPRVVVEPADFARALDADPVARTAYDRLSYSRKREHVLAIESAKKAETRRRLIEKALAMLRDQESAGAVRPAPRLKAITPDIFERITPAMARDELSAWSCRGRGRRKNRPRFGNKSSNQPHAARPLVRYLLGSSSVMGVTNDTQRR
jgi:Bacteriocin-protection, YdeI or OmpD-Associated/Domain of unknown function (DUF1905)